MSLCTVFDSISSNIYEVLSINPSANVIDLVNSVLIFLKLSQIIISNYLIQMVNFPTPIPDCNSHSPALLDLFISSDASICSTMASPCLGNSDHVVVSISIDFPSNSQWDALFHCVAYDYYCCADSDSLNYHFRDVPWEDIFKLSAFAAVSEFCEWVQVGIDWYISLIMSIKSSLTHLHGFLLLVLLP